MFTRSMIVILSLPWLVVRIHADELPKYMPIDPETVQPTKSSGRSMVGLRSIISEGLVFYLGKMRRLSCCRDSASIRCPTARFQSCRQLM